MAVLDFAQVDENFKLIEQNNEDQNNEANLVISD